MTDPGLNQRLRQRSRRAGIMIGISMALTIAVLVGGFSLIYAALDDTVGDFISRDVPAPIIPTTPTEQTVASTDTESEELEAEPEPSDDPEPEPPVEAEEPEEAEATEEDEEDSDGFAADFLSSEQAQLNFRSEPSTAGGQSTVITLLDEGTPLQFTGETQSSDDPAVDGADGWMLFELEDGTEGWLRAIDVLEVEP
ncbi:MAG: SH3 domain-containing protein [Chloroflexia bacterium]|nr:SH3 domain-containing protein [Chloroflexia bacterium]